MGKVRPQILSAIVVLGGLSVIGILNDYNEIASVSIGGIIALGMKVLEAE